MKDFFEIKKIVKEVDPEIVHLHSSKAGFLGRFVGKLFLKTPVEKQCKKFKDFFDENINLTKQKYYSNEELKENLPIADVYCTGSNQIWNSDWNRGIEKAFFLDFVPQNKKRLHMQLHLEKIS